LLRRLIESLFVRWIEGPERKAEARCPCCGFRTLPALDEYAICPVCFWEDDGQTDADADEVRGGANADLSLSKARENYGRLGACEERFLKNVRPPRQNEL
jgi:hypothetical protein